MDKVRWLLTGGNRLILKDYVYVYDGSTRQWSRTSQGIMKHKGLGWRVPSEFAGSIRNNWITRGIKQYARPQLRQAFSNIILNKQVYLPMGP